MGLWGLVTGNDGRQAGMGRGRVKRSLSAWNPHESSRLASKPIPGGPWNCVTSFSPPPLVFLSETCPETQGEKKDVVIIPLVIQNELGENLWNTSHRVGIEDLSEMGPVLREFAVSKPCRRA